MCPKNRSSETIAMTTFLDQGREPEATAVLPNTSNYVMITAA